MKLVVPTCKVLYVGLGDNPPFGVFEYRENTYYFTYLDREPQHMLFSFPDPSKVYCQKEPFFFLSNRVMCPTRTGYFREDGSRTDYEGYLNTLGLTKKTYHPFDELEKTKGQKVTDDYYLRTFP